MKPDKKNLLCIVRVAPPLTGFTTMNGYVAESSYLRDHFDITLFPISFATGYKTQIIDLVAKTYRLFVYLYNLLILLIKKRFDLAYFTISPEKRFIRDLCFVAILKCFKTKIVYHLHGRGIEEATRNNIIKKVLYRWAYKDVYVICLSKLLCQDIKSVYIGSPYIVANGIPAKPESERIKGAGKNSVSILFLSHLMQDKGLLDFINALSILKKEGQDFAASIVGEPYDITIPDLIKILTKENLKSNVQILGPKYGVEKDRILYDSDLFVFPTKYKTEALALVVLEAMRADLPVVATREAALPEIVDDGITGFLVEKGNPADLADKIGILLNDKKLREDMGRAGYKKFQKHYTLECFEKNLSDVFFKITKGLKNG